MATNQSFFCRRANIASDAAVYTGPLHGANAGWNATETVLTNQVFKAGTFKRLRVRLEQAPGAGNSRTFTVYKNGSPTTITITISDTATSAIDTTHEVAFAEDDLISVEAVGASSAAATGIILMGLEYVASSGNGKAIYGFGGVGVSNCSPINTGMQTGSPGIMSQTIICSAGTFDGMKVVLATAPGLTKFRTFAFYKNGTIQDGSGGTPDTRVTISDLATTGSSAVQLTCALGDKIDLRVSENGAAVSLVRWCTGFTADNDGEWNWSCGNENAPADGRYLEPEWDFFVGWTATNTLFGTPRGIIPHALRISNLRATTQIAVGADCHYFVTINGTDTALDALVANGTASGSDLTHQVNVSADDEISFHVTGSGANRLTSLALTLYDKAAGGGKGPSKGGKGGGGVTILTPGSPLVFNIPGAGVFIDTL